MLGVHVESTTKLFSPTLQVVTNGSFFSPAAHSSQIGIDVEVSVIHMSNNLDFFQLINLYYCVVSVDLNDGKRCRRLKLGF